MGRLRIGFVTAEHCAELTSDDRLAARALEARGATVSSVVWSRQPRPAVDALVVRSAWDYHRRADEFAQWLLELEADGVTVWNPVPLLRWNMDKRYLRELQQAGIRAAATDWVEPGSPPLVELLRARDWDEVVVKPAISASGWRTFRSNRARAGQDEPSFREALSGGLAMVQPFVPQIAQEGEWSLVYLGGRFSHAALKHTAPGGFLVQTEHGGSIEPAIPTATMIQDAERVLAAAPGPTLYARVDGARQGRNLILMELELLEPQLFFEFRPQAAEEFADVLLKALGA